MNVLLKNYNYLYLLLFCVYFAGLFIPLMENDSAQHATMAMRMYLENDFLNIYKGTSDYLDKPHMHFWLAALSFKVFGLHDWAYRIPALVFTFIGAYSCFKLTQRLYKNEKFAHFGSLVFLSAQAIILANHDVRTDAVLTGATIFSIWQFITYISSNSLKNMVLGCIGAGIAFSTKGHLGLVVIFICVMSQLIYKRKLQLLLSWKFLVGLFTLLLTISPVLYAYYVQFDLHPEKVIHGTTGNSGLRFILWDQIFNRLNAKGFSHTSPDYSFFFHTLLWAFLPWAILMYVALYSRIKNVFQKVTVVEVFTSFGFLFILCLISFSKFKLPHYLNSLLPVASVLVAGYLIQLEEQAQKKTLKVLFKVQNVILVLLVLLGCFLVFYPFLSVTVLWFVFFALISIFVFLFTRKQNIAISEKIIIYAVLVVVTVNIGLNTNFYPNLLKYRSGNTMAGLVKDKNIDVNKILVLDRSWALDFYLEKQLQEVTAEDVLTNSNTGNWLFLVDEKRLKTLEEKGLTYTQKFEANHYRITKLTLKFLNPKTRNNEIEKGYLLQLK